ncbi:molybdopterin molybdenumtransferase MoeA [Pontibacter diazotrophicus]|uniref:Molybdopterin molybdenumtransferase n=1 Tax=Pontibacter diazotrophicus TaxID=1400979 RepID=A0A3D8LC83_9BACT|nr:molybdopterin molybdotransferase MoeA [Pontibacter diazotrophicus]RDV14953.1 molybdopterin molybdenumtransferase MoeA [Pontibacter diazotrophicus]
MVQVEEAEAIIKAEVKDFGTESVPFEEALGRVLAEDLKADRDMPPYNRVAMDGIAFRYEAIEQGIQTFNITATQAAGDKPVEIQSAEECVEIMTGAALPASTDTVVRYEDLVIQDGMATLQTNGINKGQNIHAQGKDKKQQEPVALASQVVTPALIGVAAAVGAKELQVKTLPKVVVISTGDELVKVEETPLPYQIRRSNSYTIKAALQQYGLQADLLHIPDDVATLKRQLNNCLQQYDVLILSGGISMGKFDYVPQVLEELAVTKLFHKVKQRPGKPFWFGKHDNGVHVFALPGNPVSTFMCFHRYFLPWLQACLGIGAKSSLYAALSKDITFNPSLQYFLQVNISLNEQGQMLATPLEGNGSGDFANLVEADAFLELPAEGCNFKQGEVYRVWPFRRKV